MRFQCALERQCGYALTIENILVNNAHFFAINEYVSLILLLCLWSHAYVDHYNDEV